MKKRDTISDLRRRLDVQCKRAADADPDGMHIEHINHCILVLAHELGVALNRKITRPMSQRAMRALGHR